MHRLQTESGKSRFQSTAGGSCRVNPLVQRTQHAGGRTPDVALFVRHLVKTANDATEFSGPTLVVDRVHQKRERYLEHIVDFGSIDLQFETGTYPRQRRQNS